MTSVTERYRTPRASRTSLPRWAWAAMVGAMVAVVATFWALTSLNAASTLQVTTVRFSVPDDTSATLDARIVVAADTPLACAVQAENPSGTVVGYRVVEVPGVSETSRVVPFTLRTNQAATLVRITQCWLPTGQENE